MLRKLHRWPGLFAMLILTVLALSGAALSIFPASERLATQQAEAGLNVAQLAERIKSAYPGVEQIKRAPSGRITAYWTDGENPGSAVIDPDTGRAVAAADPNEVQRWLVNLHRSLFLGDAGRIVMAVGAAAMLILAFSGVFLVARRAGGWRHWFAKLRGPLSGRIHVEIARMSILGLLLSATTALWMSASTFELLPAETSAASIFAEASGATGAALTAIPMLKATPVAAFRELSFPYADDATDVYTLKTDQGTALIDQGTGKSLAWTDLSGLERLSEAMTMLHTGKGAAVLGLVLGVMALGVPLMAGTGVVLWLAGRRSRPKIMRNAKANQADTIILVGSESGSTWGFASTLHKALVETGQAVHTTAMSSFDPAHYARAQRMLILAATYGDGDAPASAKGFLDRLSRTSPKHVIPLAVLGFGDRSFPTYCSFADAVAQSAEARGWPVLVPFETVDRQSPQDFARWGHMLGAALGLDLNLTHIPAVPASEVLTLISRRNYGVAVQAPTSILRFALPSTSLWQRLVGRGFSKFEAGDLLGILPEGSAVPRFYSLASASREGFVEIVVRKQSGGLCSGQLMNLRLGEGIKAFIRRNPTFHMGPGNAPLILVGAGTGIAPFAGFVRGNILRRPIHLFFGLRHPGSDLLYGADLARWKSDGRLARLVTATSRGKRPYYVQDSLRNEATQVAALIRSGARIMVCGGRDMAAGVKDALTDILKPIGLTPALLQDQGRYVEDVY